MNDESVQMFSFYLLLASGVMLLLVIGAGVFLLLERRKKILNEIEYMESAHLIANTKDFSQWDESDSQTVRLACLMSAYRNSTRDNNVCQGLASLFRQIYDKLDSSESLTDQDIALIQNYINYWAWSIGEGSRPKLFSLPR